eukprot:scaffold83755_cov36-Phaeocystis_antarctica.AAC.1
MMTLVTAQEARPCHTPNAHHATWWPALPTRSLPLEGQGRRAVALPPPRHTPPTRLPSLLG